MRDCIIKETELIDRAIELGHKVVAITDHESISNAVKVEKYYNKIKENNPDFKVIRGNEIYLCRNGLNAQNFNKEYDKYYHFILLAKDEIGFRQICEISTRAWLRSYVARGMRRVPTYYQDLFDIIGANPGHVIGSTACLGGALPTQILRGTDENKLRIWIKQMDDLFGHGNFFLEMQPSKNKEQIIVNKKLYEFGCEFQIPYIITTDSHYLKKEDRKIHKAYLNAQNGDREVDDFYATTYLMDTEELESFFPYFEQSDLQHAYESIELIAAMCEDYSILKPLKIPSLKWRDIDEAMMPDGFGWEEFFEKIPMLETFADSEFESDNRLVKAIYMGVENHPDLQNDEAYAELNSNLKTTWDSSVVNKAQWSAYFLNLQKIIDECWNAGTLVGPSRGSGGGFLLLYCLDIIQMNKMREPTPMYPWRFLNPERVSVLDIDTDIEGGRRADVLKHLRESFGEEYVSNVATFRTEKSKSAILTAARGLGIDVDIAQYIASLIPADRGQLRSLDQCMYGDEENGWPAIKQFVTEMTDNYPELWEVAHSIEGLICGSGIHAGGVIFVDEPFTNSTGLMRAPDGTICTQFDLHDDEDVSLIKMDLLSVEALDKMHNCIDLLCDYGYAERKETLRETYEDIVGVYKIEREDPEMWRMIWNHEIQSLFQMEQESGINGIAVAHPKSIDELAVLNSVIRLMAPEKGAEQPLAMWGRYRKDINEWYSEMRRYGLNSKEIEWLANSDAIHDGICESQEGMMSLVQTPELGGNSLTFADKVRKAVAKKQGKLFEECEEKFFENIDKNGCSKTLAHYVWDVLLKVQRGYSFNASHTHAYSLIALQEMNLAYKYPIMFWNCACLISDAGGNEADEEDEDETEANCVEEIYYNEMEEFGEDDNDDDIEDSYEEEDCEGFPAEVVVMKDGKKKKKVKATNYGRIASAIGKIKSTGVEVSHPDINESGFTFAPDVKNNTILYGLSGITRISNDLIKEIIAKRPYASIEDFMKKIKVNKPQMINLIKSGAFDCFDDRIEIMKNYVESISDKKNRLTLQNMKMLCDYNILPQSLDFEKAVYHFNKYLKKMKKDIYYIMDEIAYGFFEKNFDVDLLVNYDSESGFAIKQAIWDKIYTNRMNPVRDFLKTHQQTLLEELNGCLYKNMWDKYCQGSISHWEMESISCYFHEHELEKVKNYKYNIVDYSTLPGEPEIDYTFHTKDGKEVPIFKISRIAGTVLDRDKNKKTVTLLTTSGVVTVKIYGEVFSNYDKRISEKGADGKKHIIEESFFKRGNKIIVCGIRREDSFQAKKYNKTPYHLVELIEDILDDGYLITRGERYRGE